MNSVLKFFSNKYETICSQYDQKKVTLDSFFFKNSFTRFYILAVNKSYKYTHTNKLVKNRFVKIILSIQLRYFSLFPCLFVLCICESMIIINNFMIASYVFYFCLIKKIIPDGIRFYFFFLHLHQFNLQSLIFFFD